MPSRERHIDRGTRLALRQRQRVGDELREARIGLGLSQEAVSAASGVSQSQISRIERGTLSSVTVEHLCRIGAVLGLDASIKFYPGGRALRDQGQIDLIGRFRGLVGTPLRCLAEVPMPIPGDQRAWDLMVVGGIPDVGLEAETKLRDCQAVQRRMTLKCRDSGIERVILLVADTHANRRAIRDADATLREMFPVPAREALRDLRSGRIPAGSSLIVL